MAEKRTIELEIQDNSKSLKQQYKEAVAELQKLSATYGETSEQAANAAKKAAELAKKIADEAAEVANNLAIENALRKLIDPIANLKTNIINLLKKLKDF